MTNINTSDYQIDNLLDNSMECINYGLINNNSSSKEETARLLRELHRQLLSDLVSDNNISNYSLETRSELNLLKQSHNNKTQCNTLSLQSLIMQYLIIMREKIYNVILW